MYGSTALTAEKMQETSVLLTFSKIDKPKRFELVRS